MTKRQIRLYPDAPLTDKAVPFETIDDGVAILADEMLDSMYELDGIGLAAPQVGVSKRMLVLFEPHLKQELCLVNPVLSEPDGQQENEEGCLSLPRVFAMVKRPNSIRVNACDQHGLELDFVAEGFLACIIQHEYDHLDGTVFIDRLDFLTREEKYQEWMELRKTLADGNED